MVLIEENPLDTEGVENKKKSTTSEIVLDADYFLIF